MAIIKSIEQPQGTTFAFWRVGSFTLDRIHRFAKFTLHGYLTKADFLAGKASLPTRNVHFTGVDFDALLAVQNVSLAGKTIVDAAETLFKARTDADAEDPMTGGVIDTDAGI